MSNIPYKNKPITITTQEYSLITQHKLLTLLGLTLLLTSMILTTLLFTPQQALAKDSPYVNEMYRLYNPNSGEHFYTANYYEKINCEASGWQAEGIGWYAPVHSNEPVYRVYNPNSGDHHYTLSKNEKDSLVKLGWKDEGIGWYSSENHDEALYRSYNPNALTGNHNYTRNKKESDYLNSIGWNDEGIGWYGAPKRTYEESRLLAQKQANEELKTKYNYKIYLVGYNKTYDSKQYDFYYYVDTNNPTPFSAANGFEDYSLYWNPALAPKFTKPNRVVLSHVIKGALTPEEGFINLKKDNNYGNDYEWFNGEGGLYGFNLPDYAPSTLKNATQGHILKYRANESGHDFDENNFRIFAECVNSSVTNVAAINASQVKVILDNTQSPVNKFNVLAASKKLVESHIQNDEECFFVDNYKQWLVQ